MRSRIESLARLLLLAASLAVMAAPRAQAPATLPAASAVRAAAQKVARDTDLGGKVKRGTLQLKEQDRQAPQPADAEGVAWLAGLLRWFAEAGRMLVWLAGAIVVGFLVVGIRYWIHVRAEAAVPKRTTLPSHVQSLDIRPGSLPADIGAAAAALWEQGNARAALSLLYRGALSRLVHDHAVPIRGGSTEGECVALAAHRLDAARGAFFARLVRAWQLAVYGARLPDAQQALALCRDFGAQLDVPHGAEGVR